jgi:hypothetical protein
MARGGNIIEEQKMGDKSVIRETLNLAGLMIFQLVTTAFIFRRVPERRLLAPTCLSASPSVHI